MLEELEQELSDSNGLKARVLSGYRHLLTIRKLQPAFHPAATQEVLRLSANVFAIIRSTDSGERLLCIVNVTAKSINIEINLLEHGLPTNVAWIDQLTRKSFLAQNQLSIELAPYECLWLKPEPQEILHEGDR